MVSEGSVGAIDEDEVIMGKSRVLEGSVYVFVGLEVITDRSAVD
jgi:hypothetical protein